MVVNNDSWLEHEIDEAWVSAPNIPHSNFIKQTENLFTRRTRILNYSSLDFHTEILQYSFMKFRPRI